MTLVWMVYLADLTAHFKHFPLYYRIIFSSNHEMKQMMKMAKQVMQLKNYY